MHVVAFSVHIVGRWIVWMRRRYGKALSPVRKVSNPSRTFGHFSWLHPVRAVCSRVHQKFSKFLKIPSVTIGENPRRYIVTRTGSSSRRYGNRPSCQPQNSLWSI